MTEKVVHFILLGNRKEKQGLGFPDLFQGLPTDYLSSIRLHCPTSFTVSQQPNKLDTNSLIPRPLVYVQDPYYSTWYHTLCGLMCFHLEKCFQNSFMV